MSDELVYCWHLRPFLTKQIYVKNEDCLLSIPNLVGNYVTNRLCIKPAFGKKTPREQIFHDLTQQDWANTIFCKRNGQAFIYHFAYFYLISVNDFYHDF